MANLILVLLTVLFTGCGLALSKPDTKILLEQRQQELPQNLLTGKFQSLSGEPIDLTQQAMEIQILLFVSETCLVCREETEELVELRRSRGEPLNVHFYSLVVGAYPEDARDWGTELGVNWTLGIDPGDSLFRNYCPELLTPCTLLRNPSTGKITKLIGKHSFETWQQITGDWSYQ